jgi:ABC-type multidrug transport system fused ATPase/permease subunit
MLSFSVTKIQNFNPNKHDIMQITTHFVIFDMIDVLLYINFTQVWHVPLARVLPYPQLIFPSKTWFFRIYLNFQQQKSNKNQYFSHFESKYYQIDSIKSFSSRSFQQHQRHVPISPKISVEIQFNFQWKNHSIKAFYTASAIKPGPCTLPPLELSKNVIWSILVRWIP